MKFILKIVIPLLVIFYSQQSLALVWAEPAAGFLTGGADQTRNSVSTDYDYAGFEMGGRLGFYYAGLFGGMEYMLSSFKFKGETSNSTKFTDGIDRINMGGFLGFRFPGGFRFWLTYYFDSEMKDSDDNSNNGGNTDLGDKFEGDGFGFALGFEIIPFFSLNLEYRSFSYDAFNDTSTGTRTAYGSGEELSGSEVVVSASLPFHF